MILHCARCSSTAVTHALVRGDELLPTCTPCMEQAPECSCSHNCHFIPISQVEVVEEIVAFEVIHLNLEDLFFDPRRN